MERKSLVSKKTAPASKSSSRGVDLSRPAPVRLLAACSSGKHIKKVTIEMLRA
jgi:type VI protein secretion system component Hcp